MNIFKGLFFRWKKKKEQSMLRDITQLVVLKGNSYPCEKCGFANEKCYKLHFCDRTICVTHKSNAELFGKRI